MTGDMMQPQYPGQQPYYPPQQQAQQQPYYPPQQQTQQAPESIVPEIVDPTFGELGPAIAEIAGRLVSLIPLSYDPNAKGFEPGQIQPSVTFDMYVLDGGELTFGAAPKATPPRPYPTHRVATPVKFSRQTTQNVNLVRAMQPFVGQNKAVSGRIVQSTIGSKGSKPWNLQALEPNDPGRQTIAQFFGALAAGTYQMPEPQPLAGQPTAPPQQHYAPQAQNFGQPQQPQYPQSFGQMPQGFGQPPQQAAPQVPQQPQYMSAQQSYAAAGVAPAPAGIPAPAGFPPEMWATLSPDQQQMVLASQQQAAAPQQQAGAGQQPPW